MTVLSPEDRFYDNLFVLKDMIQEVVEQGNVKSKIITPDLLDLAFSFLETLEDHKVIIESFIERSYPYWDEIFDSSNLTVMMEKSLELFGEIGEENVSEICRLIDDHVKDKERLEGFWKFLKSQVKISINYINAERKTDPTFMKEVDIVKFGNMYQVATKR